MVMKELREQGLQEVTTVSIQAQGPRSPRVITGSELLIPPFSNYIPTSPFSFLLTESLAHTGHKLVMQSRITLIL